MATVIRFARHGSKKRPYLRIVVQDSKFPRDGRFLEHIGSYQPIQGQDSLTVKRDRLEYWLSVGAKPSLAVKNRLKKMKAAGAAGSTKPQAPPADKATTAPSKEA